MESMRNREARCHGLLTSTYSAASKISFGFCVVNNANPCGCTTVSGVEK